MIVSPAQGIVSTAQVIESPGRGGRRGCGGISRRASGEQLVLPLIARSRAMHEDVFQLDQTTQVPTHGKVTPTKCLAQLPLRETNPRAGLALGPRPLGHVCVEPPQQLADVIAAEP